MGLLETLNNAIGGGGSLGPGTSPTVGSSAAGGHGALLQEAMNLMSNTSGNGGIAGLLGAFKGAGLGHIADAWVGTGANPPANADHILSALGSDKVAQIASRLGIPPQQAASGLAAILPHLIDHLTPNGAIPSTDAMPGILEGLKDKLLGA